MTTNLLPAAFIHRLSQIIGPDYQQLVQVITTTEAPISIRNNQQKKHDGHLSIQSNVPWTTQGKYLTERPSFTADPLFHAGCYYVQEASSMFLETVLSQTISSEEPIRVLDLCAAPGGKSTLIADFIHQDALLVSNEVIKTRASVLKENMMKWGRSNVIVTNNDPKDFGQIPAFFDVIVIDAPCSGEGMFRKDKRSIQEWTEEHVVLCATRQQRIIQDVIPCLKPGGVLVYSTCTYNQLENEENMAFIIAQTNFTSIPIKLQPQWQVTERITETNNQQPAYSYHFFPHKTVGEGLFITCFRKEETNETVRKQQTKLNKQTDLIPLKKLSFINQWIESYDVDKQYIMYGTEIVCLNENHLQDFYFLKKHLHILQAGLNLGEAVRDQLNPHHQLAMSNQLVDSVPFVDVDLSTAIKYLQKQTITVSSDARTGWNLVRYKDQNLGWIKVLPNRVNNYYPKNWRILSDIEIDREL